MNIQNMNLFNGDREQAINIAKIIKDKYHQSRKHTRDYSGLKAYFANDLYVDMDQLEQRRKIGQIINLKLRELNRTLF